MGKDAVYLSVFLCQRSAKALRKLCEACQKAGYWDPDDEKVKQAASLATNDD